MASRELRIQARKLYKELHYLAREYPDPNYRMQDRLHNCFARHVGKSEDEVRQGIAKAEFIKKEIEALYFLKKYRSIKSRYYDD